MEKIFLSYISEKSVELTIYKELKDKDNSVKTGHASE